jgi:hypothetical protein
MASFGSDKFLSYIAEICNSNLSADVQLYLIHQVTNGMSVPPAAIRLTNRTLIEIEYEKSRNSLIKVPTPTIGDMEHHAGVTVTSQTPIRSTTYSL